MDYRTLGRTGVKVSPLCLGCIHFGNRIDEAASLAIIDAALDAGINFIDTADVYAEGHSERIVGKALSQGGRRHRVVLTTKVFGPMDPDDPNASGTSRRHIIEGCDASLRRLRTDWIDLYLLHRRDPETPIDESLGALDDLVRAGKVRYVGTSTVPAWEIVESLWVSRELGLNRVVCEQPPYNLLDRRIERELVPMALSHGIGLMTWAPLAGGLLSGRYRHGRPFPDGRWHSGRDWAKREATDEAMQVVEGLVGLAEARGCTPAALALAWTMQQPGITSPILGPRTPEQLAGCLEALDVALTDADRAALDQIAPPGGMKVPFYRADQWRPHMYRW